MTNLMGGAGAQNWTLTVTDGTSTANGGPGTDSLTIDWSTTPTSSYQFGSVYAGGSADTFDTGSGMSVIAVNIEKYTVLFGAGNSDFSANGNSVVTFDGGAGLDIFRGDFSTSLADISFILSPTVGATSTFAGQGSKVKNVEAVHLTTGAGNDSLTGGANNDHLAGGLGSNILKGGAGDDELYSSGVDTVDGGAGHDIWVGDYAHIMGALSVGDVGGVVTLSNGTSVTNVEDVRLTTGSGDDSFVITRGGLFDGGAGVDNFTLDWSSGPNYATGYLSGGSNGFVINDPDGTTAIATNIEVLSVKLGAQQDVFYVFENGVVHLDSGGGGDVFHGNFSASTADISFVHDQAPGAVSTFVGQGTTIKGVSRLDIQTGSGNDSLTGGGGGNHFHAGLGVNIVDAGGGEDSIISTGIDTVDGGGGYDRWYGNYSSMTTGLTVTGVGDTFTLSNGGSVTNVNEFTISTGSGDDIFNMSNNFGGFVGGDGIDTMTIDWSWMDSDAGLTWYPGYILSNFSPVLGFTADGVEVLTSVTFGSGNDGFELLDDVGNTSTVVDGGAGIDRFTGRFIETTADISFTLDETPGSISTIVGQGTTVTNVERVSLTTGSGNDILTGGSQADYLAGWLGTNILNGLGGDDQLASTSRYDLASLDTVDGGEGNDSWLGDYSGQNVDLTMTRDGDVYTLSNGTVVSNVEKIDLRVYYQSDNSAEFGAGGSFSGGEGFDTVLLDWSESDGYQTGHFNYYPVEFNATDADRGWSFYGSWINDLTVKFGSGDSEFFANNITLDFDGGGGNDRFEADFSLYSVTDFDVALDFALNETPGAVTAVGWGTTITNVESIDITASQGDDSVTGGSLSDRIDGHVGNDILDGGAGGDMLIGGLGDDIYYVDNLFDTVVEVANQGNDTVYSSVNFSLVGRYVERLVLTGGGNVDVTGNAFANILTGNGGNNLINGGGGADSMAGGLGDDIYVVDSADDAVTELAGQGSDEVRTNLASYSLAANVEKLTGTSGGGQTLTGNDLANIIVGGFGADTMAGGFGDDVYYVTTAADNVVESANQGNDRIYSSFSYTLVGRHVETLALLGTSNLSATGNAFANLLIGNDGNNLLNGGGGADAMTGGLGNDVYVVDNAADAVTELVDAGTDEVQTGLAAYVLAANVERLTGTSGGGQTLTGNALGNLIAGSLGNDVLDGGAGDDRMSGGFGDDVYYVDSSGDDVVESSNRGNDTIYSAVSYGLNGRYVETLVLTGTDDLEAFGNGLANALVGNAGDNRLSGLGGSDILTGGAGSDRFLFTTKPGSGNVDSITDFNPDDDVIELSSLTFKAGPYGTLHSQAFVIGPTAADATDRIIYDDVTGTIYYDADGTGATAAVAFAQIGTGLALTNADFVIL